MLFRPPGFWLAGLLWLILSALLGAALFIGMTIGSPLPSQLRLVHVHGALVGGVAQIILGAMLSFVSPLLLTGGTRSDTHPVLFLAVNGGTLGLTMGFGLRNYTLAAIAGLVVLFAFLALLSDIIGQVKHSLISPPLNIWFYGVALLMLFAGLGIGIAMALHLWPPALAGHVRLAHIHLNLLGFVTLTIIGTMHNFLPTILQRPLFSPALARLTFRLIPAGVLLLVAGFLLSQIVVELLAGCLLLAGLGCYAYNVWRTWLAAGRPRNVASDHLILATLFLLMATVSGLLISGNALFDPPKVPIGTLHLVAYTHLALVGFILQTIMGALSHLLPITLTIKRVKAAKRRGPYLELLTGLVQRLRMVQLGALSLGTMGLSLVAALVWQFPLTSLQVRLTASVSTALLLLALVLFGVKVLLLLSRMPDESPRALKE